MTVADAVLVSILFVVVTPLLLLFMCAALAQFLYGVLSKVVRYIGELG